MDKIKGGYYIKAKCIQESDIAHAPPHIREVWDWLLMTANYEDTETCKRGELFTDYEEIIKGLSWKIGWRKMSYSRDQMETALKALRTATRITTRRTTRGLFIKVLNYEYYQNPKNYENRDDNHTDNHKENHDDNPPIQKEIRIKKKEVIKPIAASAAVGMKKPTAPFEIVAFFFEEKKWEMNQKIARRYFRAAKDLLAVCNGNLETAKKKISSLKVWAESKKLDWSLETVLKRFHDLGEKKANPKAAEYRDWYLKEYGVEPIS